MIDLEVGEPEEGRACVCPTAWGTVDARVMGGVMGHLDGRETIARVRIDP